MKKTAEDPTLKCFGEIVNGIDGDPSIRINVQQYHPKAAGVLTNMRP